MTTKQQKEKGHMALVKLINKMNSKPQPQRKKRIGEMVVDRWFSAVPHPLMNIIQARQEIVAEQNKVKLETELEKVKMNKPKVKPVPSYIS